MACTIIANTVTEFDEGRHVRFFRVVGSHMNVQNYWKPEGAKWARGNTTYSFKVDPCRFLEVMGNESKKGTLRYIKVL